MTTASEANALAAHEQGSSDCRGQVELIADFASSPIGLGAMRRRRRRGGSPGAGHGAAPGGGGQDPG